MQAFENLLFSLLFETAELWAKSTNGLLLHRNNDFGLVAK